MCITFISSSLRSLISLCLPLESCLASFFFFNTPATTEIYTLSLHDALPIYPNGAVLRQLRIKREGRVALPSGVVECFGEDRKSTRLNSSHRCISYAVFCLKKKRSTGIRATHRRRRRA